MLLSSASRAYFAAWREFTTLAIVTLLTLAGLLAPIDNALTDAAFGIDPRPASGAIVIVQIDAKSLNALDTWPWPRSRHAAVIDKLVDAGAKTIAIDIDFSSKSKPDEDKALAAAIERAGGRVILPVFSQASAPGISEDQILSRPLPEFRKHATTGHVNVRPDGNIVRHASIGTYFADGRFEPSMVAAMAQNGRLALSEFVVDFSIQPDSIPRLSYLDVLQSSFDPSMVAGKTVVIGATAIELGDMMPVPVHGIVPGVVFQVLAAESIYQNRMLNPSGPGIAILLTVISVLILRPARAAYTWRAAGLPHLGWALILLAGGYALQSQASVIVSVAAPLTATLLSTLFVIFRELEQRAIELVRERAESSHKRAVVNLVVSDSSDGIIVVDEKGRLDILNDQAVRMLGPRAPDRLGVQIEGILPRFDDLSPTEGTSGSGRDVRSCELKVDRTGHETTLEVVIHRSTLAPETRRRSKASETRFDVYTIRDISERKRAAEAERTAQEQKLAAERGRSQFVSVISHELRTPLNAIIGFSELMTSPAGEAMPHSDHMEFAREIDKSGKILLSLVNDIIDVTRLEGGSITIDIDDIETVGFLEGIVESVRNEPSFRDHVIDIQLDNLSSISSDGRYLRRVVQAVLSNAVKFSPAGSLVTLTGTSTGTRAMIEVCDRGAGIAPEHLPRVTELFYRADNSMARLYEGRGLGLYLAKKQMDLLGGTLEIESQVGVGTRVRIILPDGASVERMHAPPRPAVVAAA